MKKHIQADKNIAGQEVRPYPALTSEVVPKSSWREIIMTLLGTGLLISIINILLIFYLDANPSSLDSEIVGAKWDLLNARKTGVDWLILGDSAGMYGVIPEVIEEKLGGEALNVATMGNWGLVDDVWMLETHIERFGPPKHVIVIHVYDVYARDMKADFIYSSSPLAPSQWDHFRLSPDFDATEQIKFYIFRSFPLIYRNVTLQNIFRNFFLPSENANQTSAIVENAGYARFDASEDYTLLLKTNYEHHRDVLSLHPFRISDVNREALQLFIDLSEEYDFDVYIFNSPLYEPLAAEETYQARLSEWFSIMESLLEHSERVHFTYLEEAAFPAALMANNVDHVNHEGASRYTRMIIEAIAALQAH